MDERRLAALRELVDEIRSLLADRDKWKQEAESLHDDVFPTSIERHESALRGCGEALEMMRTDRDRLRNAITALADEWEQEQSIGSQYPERLRALLAPDPRESKG